MDNLISLQVAIGLAGTGLAAGALGVVLLAAAFVMSRRAPRSRAPAPPPTRGTEFRDDGPGVQPLAPVPTAKLSRPGCGQLFACGCLALVVLLVLGGGGGYLAYRNGLITLNTVLALVGLGPGDIEVDNFRDDTVFVAINQLDAPQDSSPTSASLELAPFEIRQYRVQDPGRYQVGFSTAYGSADLGTCNLTLKSGDQYQFVPMPERIAVNRANRPSQSGTDFVVATSALCR